MPSRAVFGCLLQSQGPKIVSLWSRGVGQPRVLAIIPAGEEWDSIRSLEHHFPQPMRLTTVESYLPSVQLSPRVASPGLAKPKALLGHQLFSCARLVSHICRKRRSLDCIDSPDNSHGVLVARPAKKNAQKELLLSTGLMLSEIDEIGLALRQATAHATPLEFLKRHGSIQGQG